MGTPTLVFVTGPPGSGKTTLAHRLGSEIACPVVCRDEIKLGLVHADGGRVPTWGGPGSQLTHETFFAVLRVVLGAGATVVAEAALQNDYWRPDIEQLLKLAQMRIIHWSDASGRHDGRLSTAHGADARVHQRRLRPPGLDPGLLESLLVGC